MEQAQTSFDLDSSNQDSCISETGEILAMRRDCQKIISQRAQDDGISEEDAWKKISEELLSHFKQYQKTPQSTQRNKPASVEIKGVIENISDEMLPPELQKNGIGVLEALNRGLVNLEGEHPLAQTLKNTIENNQETAEQARQLINAQAPGLQFKLWSETVKVMPSDLNRTSLFHVGSNNVRRRFCRNERLGRVGTGVSINYQGEELRLDSDGAVFKQLLHEARGKKPWDWIVIRKNDLIRGAKNTKRRLAGKDTDQLHDILMRLRGGLLLIQSSKRGFITCNLLSDYENRLGDLYVRIDPRVVLLFDTYATLDERALHSLGSIAQKIYNYIQTVPHSGVHPILISNLFELCYGTKKAILRELERTYSAQAAETAFSKKFSDFRVKNLPAALDELVKHGLILSFNINKADQKVSIIKNPTSPEVLEIA